MKTNACKRRMLYIGALGVAILLALYGVWRGSLANDRARSRAVTGETLVVAQRSDPYYSLAQRIAETDKLGIVEEFDQVLDLNPRYVILVASPDRLTKETLLHIGRVLKEADYYPALGIITGSTLQHAERLWARRDQAQGGKNYVGGDVETTQLVNEPAIFDISKGSAGKIALDKDSLIAVLKQADYLYWARHTAATNWFWNEADVESADWGGKNELFARDIPPLKPVVIYTPSCSSFRPWVEGSIALGFVDQGAAAYLGHPVSPYTNAFLKRGLAVPGLSSWKEFPLGLVAAVGNRVETKTVFKTPQLFMLGDPRLYLAKEQPYRIISDETGANGKRVIAGESAVEGVLALKIEKGSAYDYLAIEGLTAVSEHAPFYNSKLQTLNLGADKYVLFLHDGGDFRIELAPQAPLGWVLADALTDALDYSWVVLWLNVEIDNAPFLYMISLPVFAAILLFKVLRRRSLKDYRRIFIVAFLFACLRLAYFLVRLDDYTVSANFLHCTTAQVVLGCAGVFATTAGGLMLMKDTRRAIVKGLGLVFAVFPQLLLAGFFLALITFMNTLTPVNSMPAMWLCNYHTFWLPFAVLVFEALLVFALYRIFIVEKKALVLPR